MSNRYISGGCSVSQNDPLALPPPLGRVPPPAEVVDYERPSEHDEARLEHEGDVPPAELGDLRERDGEEGGGAAGGVTAGGEASTPDGGGLGDQGRGGGARHFEELHRGEGKREGDGCGAA